MNATLILKELDSPVFRASDVVATPHDASDYITVPDAHLLFNGEFKRVGTNGLKIEDSDGKSFFIEDYFSNDKHKHLMSPEGALLTSNIVDTLAGPLAPGQHAQAGAQPAVAQAVIGRVETVSGGCTVVRNGVSVILNAGDNVRKGDVVVTSTSSAVAIVFTDGTTFSLSANARMVLGEFVYADGGSNNTALISLVQGTFSFLAGQVAKTGNMNVDTPVAIMGIRGTAVRAEVSAFDGTTRFIVMEERDPNTGNVTTGSFQLLDKTTGQLLATVNASSVSWIVAPSGPQQVTVTPAARSQAEIQQDFATVQQMLTIYNNFQSNPLQPQPDQPQPDQPQPDQPQPERRGQLDQGNTGNSTSAGGSGGVLTNPVNQQTNFTVTIAPGASGGEIAVGNVVPISTVTSPEAGTGATGGAEGGTASPVGGVPQPPTVTIITGTGIIVGTEGADIIYGSDGADTITALQGNDQVFAGGGSDIIIAAHGEGNDFYDGDLGFDTIRFESATTGITFNLNISNGTLGDGTPVKVSTADGAEIGQDDFVRFEKIVGSPGNDVFILHDLGEWELDGGAGVDIVRIDGALDLTATAGGPFAYNIEVLDLNQTFANTIQLNAADVFTADPNGPLRVLGGTTDVINFASTYQVGDTGPQRIGTWQLVRTFVDPTADDSSGDPFNDHVTDDVAFDVYEFVSDGQVVATVYVQDGMQIDVTPGQTNAVNDTAAMTENQSITVDILANDAPGFDTTRTLTALGSVSVTGPDGVSLGSPQVQIVNNQLSVVPGTAFDALAEGQTATITVPYTMQIGSGQMLSAVSTITVTGTNDAPTDIELSANTIGENSANGTVVGQFSAVDLDSSDPATYSLIDDAGGRFAIDGSNIVVAMALDYETATSHQVTVRVTDSGGSTYDETFTVNVGNVSGSFTGTSAGESLTGTSEEDTIQALDGDDRLQGLAGNDTLNGGTGNDSAVYSDATGGITVNLAAGTVNGAGVGTDTLLSIENITGSDFADIYDATGFGPSSTNAGSIGTINSFEGRGGDDTITGNGTTIITFVQATAGITADIAAGTATGDASVGTDTFTGISGLRGSNYNDTLLGSNTTSIVEVFLGEGGDDLIDGRGGLDRAIYASILADTVTSGINVDMASGVVTGDASVGTDTLRSIEFVRGSQFDDVYVATGFSGSSANAGSNGTFNEFEGVGGNDTITGNGNTRIAFYNATAGVTVDLAAGTATGNASVGTDTFTGVNNIVGSQFADTMYGSNNPQGTNEQFEGRAGNDVFDGRGGFDTAVYNNDTAVTAGITVDMAAGTVTGPAAIGTDTLQGMEAIRGTNFADVYVATGFSGSSTNAGSLGTFNEFEGLGGNDTITGNGDTRISFSNATAGVTVDLAAGTATGNASVGTDTFTGVSRVRGSNFADIITGNEFNNILQGLADNDTLNGGTGNDSAVYSDATGGITVNLAAGTVNGAGVGTDTLLSIENITGSDFADIYDATGFGPSSTNAGSIGTTNSFEGRGGDDTIIGNGSTIITFVQATAGITADIAAGTATGDASVGTDTFTGVSGLRGSDYNDTLRGSATTSTIEVFLGEGGDDLIDGRGGLDRAIYASILNDTVTGGINVDMASGIVTGDASVGTDTLRSIEFVRGSQFDDVYVATGFSGSSANAGSNGTFNEFEGVGGNDTITGNGNTRIAFYNATAGVTVDLAAGTATGNASVGTDTFTGVNNIVGSQFADTMYGSNNPQGTNEQFEGRAGNDVFDGRGGFDTAVYNNDTAVTAGITVDMAAGTVTGPAAIGTDTLQGMEAIRGTNFADVYVATGFSGSSTNAGSFGTFNEFEGLGGNDTITGNGNTRITFNVATAGVTVDLVAGTAMGDASVGTDTFTGVSQVRGSNFADIIIGNGSNNILEGQGGNDIITGGQGNDTLTGGADADVFVFGDGFGFDTVTDFHQGDADEIDLTGVAGVYDFETLETLATQDGANTVIDFGDGNVLTLNNVTLASLTESDFIFGVPV